jgi:hypothetical protein
MRRRDTAPLQCKCNLVTCSRRSGDATGQFWVYAEPDGQVFGVCFEHRSWRAERVSRPGTVAVWHVRDGVRTRLDVRPKAPSIGVAKPALRAAQAAQAVRATRSTQTTPSTPSTQTIPIVVPRSLPRPPEPSRPPGPPGPPGPQAAWLQPPTCPITQDVIVDPVVLSCGDGVMYEREAIAGWFQTGHRTNPVTGLTLLDLTLHSVAL